MQTPILLRRKIPNPYFEEMGGKEKETIRDIGKEWPGRKESQEV